MLEPSPDRGDSETSDDSNRWSVRVGETHVNVPSTNSHSSFSSTHSMPYFLVCDNDAPKNVREYSSGYSRSKSPGCDLDVLPVTQVRDKDAQTQTKANNTLQRLLHEINALCDGSSNSS